MKYKFELENDMVGIARQEIAIHFHNMMGYLKSLMGHPGF